MKIIVYVMMLTSGQQMGPYFDLREECELFRVRTPFKNEVICTRIVVVPPAVEVKPKQ